MNYEIQEYKGIRIKLINRGYGGKMKAKRYLIIAVTPEDRENQNVWIPNTYLEDDGTLKKKNIDFVFRKSPFQLNYAGYNQEIIGIKRRNKK